jgi:biopolymer transport protein ExbB
MTSSLWAHLRDGGSAMFPAAVCLFMVIRIAIERAAVVVRAGWRTSQLRRLVRRCILSRDWKGAAELCAAHGTPVARVVRAELDVAHESDARIQLAVDVAALAEIPKLWQSTRRLVLLGNFGVYFGLFGTMMTLGSSSSGHGGSIDPSSKARELAERISWALNSTALGLVVALAAVASFGLLRYASERVERDLKATAVEILSLVSTHRSKLWPADNGAKHETGVEIRTGHLRMEHEPNRFFLVAITCFWGEERLAALTWRPSPGGPSTYDILEPAGAPGTKLTLKSDGHGAVDWRFEQPRCPARYAFSVEVEPGEIAEFEPRGQLAILLRARSETAFPAPRLPELRALAATAASLLAHVIVVVLAAITFPALHATDEETLGYDRAYIVDRPSSGPTGPLVPIRAVQTPTHPDGSDLDCPFGAPNCEFRTPGLAGKEQPTVRRTVFRDQAAREGREDHAGYAFRNWSREGRGQLETTGLPRMHRVRAGESLRSIADKYALVRWRCIYNRELNPRLVATRVDPDRIWIGDVIWIPSECHGDEPYAPLGPDREVTP